MDESQNVEYSNDLDISLWCILWTNIRRGKSSSESRSIRLSILFSNSRKTSSMAGCWGSDSNVLDFMFTPFPCVRDGDFSIISVYRNGALPNRVNAIALIEYYPGMYATESPIDVTYHDTLIVLKFRTYSGPIIGVITGDHYLHVYEELHNFMTVGLRNGRCKLVDVKRNYKDAIEAPLAQLIAFMTDIVVKEIDESLGAWSGNRRFEGVDYIKGLDEMTLTLKVIERCEDRFAFIHGLSTFKPSIAFTLENIANIRDNLTVRSHEGPILNPVLRLAQKLDYDPEINAESYVPFLRNYVSAQMTETYEDLTASEQNILRGVGSS